MPGTGNVQVPVEVTLVDRLPGDDCNGLNTIICQPLPPFATGTPGSYTTNLPDGQYTIGLFANIKNTEGRQLRDGPVFHTITVGALDTIAPRIVTTDPVNGEQNVGAGVPPPAPPPGVPENNIASVTTNIFGNTSPDIIIRCTEGITSTSVNGNNVSVVDAGAFVPGGGAPPALAWPL